MIAVCKDPSGEDVFYGDKRLQEQHQNNAIDLDVEDAAIRKYNVEMKSWMVLYKFNCKQRNKSILVKSFVSL